MRKRSLCPTLPKPFALQPSELPKLLFPVEAYPPTKDFKILTSCFLFSFYFLYFLFYYYNIYYIYIYNLLVDSTMRVRVRAILKYRKIHRLTNLAPPLLTVSFCLWNTSRCKELGRGKVESSRRREERNKQSMRESKEKEGESWQQQE